MCWGPNEGLVEAIGVRGLAEREAWVLGSRRVLKGVLVLRQIGLGVWNWAENCFSFG